MIKLILTDKSWCLKAKLLLGFAIFWLWKNLKRNFSLVACYLLKFTHCSLLVVKTLVTCCKICSLLVTEAARCKKTLVTRCRSCSLQSSLVTRCRSFSLQEFTRDSLQNFLVTRCRSCSFQKITRCLLRNFLVNCCKK